MLRERGWTEGPCEGCGKKGTILDGRCAICRLPEDRRELVAFGVPWLTAEHLAQMLKRCNGNAQEVLGIAHPRVMQNVVVVNGTLKVRDKNWRWRRRIGWEKVRK